MVCHCVKLYERNVSGTGEGMSLVKDTVPSIFQSEARAISQNMSLFDVS